MSTEPIYVSFELNQEKKAKTRILGKAVITFLKVFIPKANPDFEHLIDHVRTWKVEFVPGNAYPEREIGLDNNGNVIMVMPIGDNMGYWTDNQLKLEDFEHFKPKRISPEEFETHWAKFLGNREGNF